MAWRIDFTKAADKALRKLDRPTAGRVLGELAERIDAGLPRYGEVEGDDGNEG